jgi:hypothetical protein
MKRIKSLDEEMIKNLKKEGLNRAQRRKEMKRLNPVYKKMIPQYDKPLNEVLKVEKD